MNQMKNGTDEYCVSFPCKWGLTELQSKADGYAKLFAHAVGINRTGCVIFQTRKTLSHASGD